MSYLAPGRGVYWLLLGSPLMMAFGLGKDGVSQFDSPSAVAEATRKSVTKRSSSTASNAPSNPRSFHISGRVLDQHGDPVSDAEVWMEDMGGDGGTPTPIWLGTDADGRFAAPEARASLYTITASARGFRARAIAVELNREITDLGLSLAPAPSPSAIVLDPEGRIVPDAVVVACSESSEVTLRSAADGTVVFAPGAIGCFVRAHHTRFARSAPARLRAESVVVLRLARGGSIEGVVTDSSGRALSGSEVSVTGFEPSEDEQALAPSIPELRIALGREFRFSGLAPGSYTLGVFRRVPSEEQETAEEIATSAFEVSPGRAVRAVHIVAELPAESAQ